MTLAASANAALATRIISTKTSLLIRRLSIGGTSSSNAATSFFHRWDSNNLNSQRRPPVKFLAKHTMTIERIIDGRSDGDHKTVAFGDC